MRGDFIYDCTPQYVHLYVLNAPRFTGKERVIDELSFPFWALT